MPNNLGTAQGAITVDTSNLKNADIALRNAGGSLVRFGELAVGAFATIVGTAAEYQRNMDTIAAISNSTEADMKTLSDAAIDMGKNSIFGPIELSKAFLELIKAGASVPDLVNGVAQAAVNLASASGESIVFAGENLLGIMNTFKLGAADAQTAADILAGAANASAIDLQDLVISMKYAGPVASALGISLLDTSTAITELGKVNIKGSTAGTALRAILLNLTPATEKAGDKMKELGLITADGANLFFDAQGKAKGLSEIFQLLQDKTQGLTDQAKVDALRDLFGVRAVPAALELMRQGAAGFQALNEEVTKTSSADVAAERNDNLAGSIDKLKATVQSLMVEAGGPFQEMLKGWVDFLTRLLKAFDDLPGPIKNFIVGSLGVVGVLSLFAGGFLLTIGNIIRMVRVFGELKNAFGVIKTLMGGGAAKIAQMGGSFIAMIGPVGAVVLAIAAIIAIVVILYNKFDWFHDFVDRIWQSIQRIWDSILGFFGDLPGQFKKAWDVIEDFFVNAWNSLKNTASDIWSSIVDAFTGALDTITGVVSTGVDAVVGFFEDLPGQIADVLGSVWDTIAGFGADILDALKTAGSAAVRGFIEFFSDFPRKIGYVLGAALVLPIRFAIEFGKIIAQLVIDLVKIIVDWGLTFLQNLASIGLDVIKWVIQFHIDMVKKFIEIATEVLTTFVDILTALPGQLWDILTSAIGYFIQFHVWLAQAAWDLATTVLSTMVNILTALPGQIWNILTTVIGNFISFGITIVQKALEIATGILTTIVNEVTQLPGQIWDILTSVVSKLTDIIPTVLAKGGDIASSLLSGIKDGIGDLAGWLWDIIKAAFSGLGNLASGIFDIGKDIASGFIHGVGDFLFGSPHTKIEYWFWDMEDNVRASMANIQSQVGRLNKMNGNSWDVNSNLSSTIASAQGKPMNGNQVSGGLTVAGPLLQVDTLTGTQEEALTISRRLADLTTQQLAAQGKRSVLTGVS